MNLPNNLIIHHPPLLQESKEKRTTHNHQSYKQTSNSLLLTSHSFNNPTNPFLTIKGGATNKSPTTTLTPINRLMALNHKEDIEVGVTIIREGTDRDGVGTTREEAITSGGIMQ